VCGENFGTYLMCRSENVQIMQLAVQILANIILNSRHCVSEEQKDIQTKDSTKNELLHLSDRLVTSLCFSISRILARKVKIV
jgi:hypothetical protein